MNFIIYFIFLARYRRLDIFKANLITHPAFSLIELTFALVAISVVLAVFIPVITSRFASESPVVSSSGLLITSQDCGISFENEYGLECTLCYGEEACVTCGGSCPLGMRKNVERCDCE